jgi:hypothetical protein
MEVNLTDHQEKLLYAMVPMYGDSPADVATFIITCWMHHNAENVLNMADIQVYLDDKNQPGGCQCQ